MLGSGRGAARASRLLNSPAKIDRELGERSRRPTGKIVAAGYTRRKGLGRGSNGRGWRAGRYIRRRGCSFGSCQVEVEEEAESGKPQRDFPVAAQGVADYVGAFGERESGQDSKTSRPRRRKGCGETRLENFLRHGHRKPIEGGIHESEKVGKKVRVKVRVRGVRG